MLLSVAVTALTAASFVTADAAPNYTGLYACLRSRKVPFTQPDQPAFGPINVPFNLRLVFTPSAIVTATKDGHIQDAVVCAGVNGVKVQARSGGHSYASFSNGGQDNSLIIDLAAYNKIQVGAGQIAQFGGGVRLGNLDLALFQQGRRAISHGTCEGVGVGGHFTHGGYGHSSRNWGLALDSIVALQVVTANGASVRVEQGNDLFWALRGAADAFGIITQFYSKTQAAPTAVVDWGWTFPNMYVNRQGFVNAMLHIQDFAQNSSVIDRKISFGVFLDGQTFRIGGQYYGDADHFNYNIGPELLRGLPIPNPRGEAEGVNWVQSLTDEDGSDTIAQPLTRVGYTQHDTFFAKSLTIPEATPFTANALGAYFDYIVAKGVRPPNPWFSIINLYGGPDSQINVKDTNFAAYKDRESLWVVQHYGHVNPPATKVDVDFINGLNAAITDAMPDADIGAYLNYIDPTLSRQEAIDSYYGAELYQRLAVLKTKYDPLNIFSNPLAIRPEGSI